MRELYIDCSMGCAGDMLTGALLELHPDKDDFIKKINAALGGRVVVSAAPDAKCGVRGTHVTMLINGEEEQVSDCHATINAAEEPADSDVHAHAHSETNEQSEHGDAHTHEHEYADAEAHAHSETDGQSEHGDAHTHEHEHEHANADMHAHSHTSISEIEDFIRRVNVPDVVRNDALAVYNLIAEAESIAHGCPIENVHFHEVGSLDALADVLSVCMLIHDLAPDRIMASHINVGSGYVKCAHGVLPVPAPATELILKAVPTYSGEVVGELCTPTGAALLKHFVAEFKDENYRDCRNAQSSDENTVDGNVVESIGKSGHTQNIDDGNTRIGTGTGTKDFAVPNVVKVVLNEI